MAVVLQVSGGLATLQISGVSLNVSSSPLDLAGGSRQVFAGLTGGSVTVQSALGGGAPVSLAGVVANSTTNVTATPQVPSTPLLSAHAHVRHQAGLIIRAAVIEACVIDDVVCRAIYWSCSWQP